ncbi:hypothetical protein ACU635_33810 [[Actinomadura] parvosata]|uniref:hypothetical protein n=1 Tax=[Actinomadura] parvosata TaxID=1955412 RepID=UPI00406CA644
MSVDHESRLRKADFDDIYRRPDPRAYYARLGDLDYVTPHYGQRVFRKVLDAFPATRPTVVDLCCSYGVNAALLKYDLTLNELYGRYRSEQVADLPRAELAAADRDFYARHLRADAPRVIGIDIAAPAVDYALEVGLLDGGATENLESGKPSQELTEAVRDAGLVTVTGGIGYITGQSIDRLYGCMPPERKPWFAALCLRTVDYTPVTEILAAYGLVTERLAAVTFPQRRFASEQERAYAMRALAEQGLSPLGKESEGSYHVNVFLSRPVEDVARRPIDSVLR